MRGLLIGLAVVGYGFIAYIIVWEHCKRKREVSAIIARIKARGCRRMRVTGGIS